MFSIRMNRWTTAAFAPVAIALVAIALAVIGLSSGPVQAGRWLPEVENPYCPVKTYALRDVAEQASSMSDRQGPSGHRCEHPDPSPSALIR